MASSALGIKKKKNPNAIITEKKNEGSIPQIL